MISFQALIIILLALSRGPWLDVGIPEHLWNTEDGNWLHIGTFVGAAITWTIMVLTYLLGDNLPLKTVILVYVNATLSILNIIIIRLIYPSFFLQEALFVMTYSVMFIATGGCAIKLYYKSGFRQIHNAAFGSMAIITGVVMFVDLLFLVKAILKK